jgi:hypothetical protein
LLVEKPVMFKNPLRKLPKGSRKPEKRPEVEKEILVI